jgi:hypothetical protein
MMIPTRTFLVATILAFSIALADGEVRPAGLKVTTKRDDDRAEVTDGEEGATVAVRSKSGIGEATIALAGEKWPTAVVVRLHVNGLEHFRASNGKVKLEGSASVREGRTTVRMCKDGHEDRPLDATSAEWIEIRIVAADGKPAQDVPVKDGYFELRLPKALFDGDPQAITVAWIDFYRN